MNYNILKLGPYVINLSDHVIISDNTFYSLGHASWMFLEKFITEYPDPVLIDRFDDLLTKENPESDTLRIRGECIGELRKVFGSKTILNLRAHSYYINPSVELAEISKEEYINLYYSCLKGQTEQKAEHKLITIRNLDGSTESVDLINAFKIDALGRRFVILSKDEKDPYNDKYDRVYVSEFTEDKDGNYELIGLEDSRIWAIVRISMFQIILSGSVVPLSSQSVPIVRRLFNKKESVEKKFIEYPYARKYFFEKSDSLPQDPIEFEQVLAIANLYASLFYEFESSITQIPTSYVNYLMQYEIAIWQSKAVEEANKRTPEQWSYINDMPI